MTSAAAWLALMATWVLTDLLTAWSRPAVAQWSPTIGSPTWW
jgi:hypothetical protein